MIVKYSERLAGLADEANDEHSRVVGAMDDAIYHMRQAGDALLEAKSEVSAALTSNARPRHAQVAWATWLRENFSASRTTADRYMLVALHYDELLAERARLAAGKKFNYIRTLDTIVHPEPDPDEPDPDEDDESEGDTQPDNDAAEEGEDVPVVEAYGDQPLSAPNPITQNYAPESKTLEEFVNESSSAGEFTELADLPSPYPTEDEEAYKAIGRLLLCVERDPRQVALTCAPQDLEQKAFFYRRVAKWVAEVTDALEQRIQKPMTVVHGGRDD